MLKNTKVSDPELYKIVEDELKRQENNIEMIASESTVPLEVMGQRYRNTLTVEEGIRSL